MSAPPTGVDWEQMLGRTHRDGQTAPVVTAHVVIGCKETLRGLRKAVIEAEFAEGMTGQSMKICSAGDFLSEIDEDDLA